MYVYFFYQYHLSQWTSCGRLCIPMARERQPEVMKCMMAPSVSCRDGDVVDGICVDLFGNGVDVGRQLPEGHPPVLQHHAPAVQVLHLLVRVGLRQPHPDITSMPLSMTKPRTDPVINFSMNYDLTWCNAHQQDSYCPCRLHQPRPSYGCALESHEATTRPINEPSLKRVALACA